MGLLAKQQRWRTGVLVAALAVGVFAASWAVVNFGLKSLAHPGAGRSPVVASHRRSADCRTCHQEIYDQWAASDHAHAQRAVDAVADADAFTPAKEFTLNGVTHRVAWINGKPHFHEQAPGATPRDDAADFVLGYKPLRQYVVPVGGGRYQMTELAFDPARHEWFNVFGGEQRHAGEWGHWTGRGMNWNSMCAQCHNTEFAKNYQPATDTYASTWLEQGIGCVQCHEGLTPDHTRPGYHTSAALRAIVDDPHRNQQTCAPCHARNELLTGEPRPGMAYFDHFRVTLPVNRATFYPDGQVRDEDFNWTSLLTSRMGGKAGITCLDCHDPHSGRTRLPVTTNALCLQCHGGPNPRNAPVIDPVAHSHHAAGSAGNQCIACHMPTTTYMQRDPRHDHGFLRPDPLLTKELGIPNACDRCHADKGIDWQIAAADRWYGAKLDSRQRQRARAVAAAQQQAPEAEQRLLALLATEGIPAWKATLLELAQPWAGEPNVQTAAQAALTDASPLVRSAAVHVLGGTPEGAAALRPMLHDHSRLVRIDAESALTAELTPGSPERRELDAYFAVSADQPVGQLRIGQDLAARGHMTEALAAVRQATCWDPFSADLHQELGLMLDAANDAAAAAAELWRAAKLDPKNAAAAFQAGIEFAGAGQIPPAETALREAVRRDPRLDRAWYNLGLLLNQTGRTKEALQAITQAESLAPLIPDYPYARAAILWSSGDRDGAREAARRVLQLDPNQERARAMLR